MLPIEALVEDMHYSGFTLTGCQPHLFGLDYPRIEQLELAEFRSHGHLVTDFSAIRDRYRSYGLEATIVIVKGAATGPTIGGSSPIIVRLTRRA